MASVMGQVGKDRGDHRLTFEGAGYILGCTLYVVEIRWHAQGQYQIE